MSSSMYSEVEFSQFVFKRVQSVKVIEAASSLTLWGMTVVFARLERSWRLYIGEENGISSRG